MDWELYIAGYKKAGDLLAEHGITHGEQHILVYPVVFLYRHYIELRLKEIIRNGNLFLGISTHFPLLFPKGHKIDDYWRDCRSIIEKMDNSEYQRQGKDEQYEYKNDLDFLQESINKFSQWDYNSEAFRYPTDTDGNPSVSVAQLRNINFRSLRELVERISYLLDGISVGISEYLNAKRQ